MPDTVRTTSRPSLLLHVCCAPCASSCIERLLAEGRNIVLFYSNSNIATAEEFELRLQWVRRLAELHGLELIVDPYNHAAWHEYLAAEIPDYASFPEGGLRCSGCFRFSLGRAAFAAKERGFHFCTSLTVSPHKNSKTIFSIGSQWKEFEAYDFKKKDGFKRSIELSKQYCFYRQAFCGCEFSLRNDPGEK